MRYCLLPPVQGLNQRMLDSKTLTHETRVSLLKTLSSDPANLGWSVRVVRRDSTVLILKQKRSNLFAAPSPSRVVCCAARRLISIDNHRTRRSSSFARSSSVASNYPRRASRTSHFSTRRSLREPGLRRCPRKHAYLRSVPLHSLPRHPLHGHRQS